jgi:hypothetical protein
MKIVLQNAVKYNGRMHRTGTVLDMSDAAAMSLIDRGAAEQAFDVVGATALTGTGDSQPPEGDQGGDGSDATDDGQPTGDGAGKGAAAVTAESQSADAIESVATRAGSRKKS